MTVEKNTCPLEFIKPGYFSKGLSTAVPFCKRNSVIWDIRVYTGSVSEWQPWALNRTRHRVSCSRQLCRNSNTVIQPLARAPEHCVYICNLTYPPGLDETPTAAVAAAAIATLFLFYFSPLIFILRPPVRILLLAVSLPLSSLRHSLFLVHKDIVEQTHPHTFSHWLPYSNTRRALKTNHVWDHAVSMCQGHCSLLSFPAY